MKVPLSAGVAALLAVFSLMLMEPPPTPGQTESVGPTVIPEIQHVTSPPLRELVQAASKPVAPQAIPLRRIPLPLAETAAPLVPDPVVQGSAGPLVSTANLLNFEGIAADGFIPPDTNGSVGATQFVETVNIEFAVYNKSNGAPLLGPTNFSTLFGTLGGLCATGHLSDPVVLYDKAAGRWLLSVLAFDNTFSSNFECVAVSASSDATGSYHLYSFSFGGNLNDYPKLGVWPDAYYLSVNIFPGGGAFSGPEACALDRTNMLAGNAATMQCFQKGTSDSSLLPSDLDGFTAPPAGSPNFFIELGTSTLNLFKFHVDFTAPPNSSFTGPVNVPVAAYTLACCIPQLGTSQHLDSLGDRLMFRLAYRNFGGHESLVVNHSVQVDPVTRQAGVRWYEIRDPNGTPTVFQQSTFAPDTNFRWMGSIAMDHAGDIAVGYSVSSSSLNPQIHYTGRVPTDPLNTMETEDTIINGTGSQLPFNCGGNPCGQRWGDYTSMSIDPVDDCTFWYSNEYLTASGDFNWHTRIGSFKFPSCIASTVTLNPPSIPFSGQLVNTTSATSNVQLTNSGTATLNIASITLIGTDPSQFALVAPTSGTPCPFGGGPINAGNSCFLGVQFKPTTTGAHSATVGVADDASGTPQTVALTGTGIAPALTLSATSVAFGGVNVGSTAPTSNVQLTNSGTATLHITSIMLTGTDTTQFALVAPTSGSPACSFGASPINVGNSCFLGVQFKPTTTGARSANVSVTDDASGSPQSVGLSGTGLSLGVVGFSAPSLTFPNTFVGTTSAPQPLTLTNIGTGPLTLFSIVATGDFAQTNNCPISPATLAVGTNCTFNVTFTPSFIGPEVGNISIVDDASLSPAVVGLSGTGEAPDLTLSPHMLPFGAQGVGTTSAVQTITATNNTGTAINIISIAAGGDFAQTNNCGNSIVSAGTCTISVMFTPTVVGTRMGSVTATFNALGSPQTTSLTGTGISQAASQLAWKLKAPFNVGVEGAAGNLISGKLYVSHGWRAGPNTTLFIYDVATDTWICCGPTAPGASVPRFEMAGGTALGKHFAIGGDSGAGPTAANEQFDPSTTVWTTKKPMSMARAGLGAASFNDKIYAIGGRTGFRYGVGPILNVVEVYDPKADAWTTLAPLPVAVSDNYATVALNGKIYVFGGTTGGNFFNRQTCNGTTNLVQIYDIGTNSWSSGASMPTPRGAAMAGVIAGRIAVFGGVNSACQDLTVTELYDPGTNKWERGPDMVSPASEMAQGVTSDGRQIFAVGSGIFGVSGTSVQVLVAPVVQFSPPSLAMGTQPVGSTSLSQTVMLTNAGGVALPISNIAASGDFAQTNNCPVSPATLAAGASCMISVTFTPASLGSKTGTVTVTDLALDTPQTVGLTGTGIAPAPALTLSATSVAFGGVNVGGTAPTSNVQLTNSGTATLNITSITLTGTDASQFALVVPTSGSPACSFGASPINVGSSCFLGVQFKPTTTGVRSANVSVADDASGSPQTVALAGTGTDFSIDPAMGGSTSATVTAGQTATYNLQVSPVSGFNGAVTLSNCSGMPSEAACTTSLATVLVNGTAAAFTVSVTTTAPSMIVPRTGPPNWPPLTGTRLIFLLLFALALLAILGRFKDAAKVPRPGLALAPTLALVLLTLAWVGGCGGGGSSAPSVPHNPGTPKGTSTFTLTATSGTVTSGTLSHTLNLTLTVN